MVPALASLKYNLWIACTEIASYYNFESLWQSFNVEDEKSYMVTKALIAMDGVTAIKEINLGSVGT